MSVTSKRLRLERANRRLERLRTDFILLTMGGYPRKNGKSWLARLLFGRKDA